MSVMTRNVEKLFRPGADSSPVSEEVYGARPEGLAAKTMLRLPT